MKKVFCRMLQYGALATALIGATISPVIKDLSPRISTSGERHYHPIEQTSVIAHRGGKEFGRENTLETFSHARQVGADLVEFDVRQSKDGQLLVYHNSRIGGRAISSLDYAQAEAAALKRGFHIPTVEEALKTLKGQKVLADLKIRGYEPKILGTLLKYIPRENLVVSSTSPESLRIIKELDPNVQTSLVMPSGLQYIKTTVRKSLGLLPWEDLRKSGADYVSVNGSSINSKFYDNATKGDASLLVYGVEDQGRVRQLLQNPSVSGVITYKPKEVLEIRSQMVSSEDNRNGDSNLSLEQKVGFSFLIILFSLVISFFSFQVTGNSILNAVSFQKDYIKIIFFFLLLIFLLLCLSKIFEKLKDKN